MTDYGYNGIVFVPSAMATNARAWFAQHNPDPNAVSEDALTVPCASVLAPTVITHHGANVALTGAFVQAMQSARLAGAINTVDTWTYTFYLTRFPDELLLETNSLTAQVGQAFDFDDALADVGLVRYVPEES